MPAKTTSAVAASFTSPKIAFNASKPITIAELSLGDFAAIPRNPIQRDENLRLNKKHLKALHPSHLVVAVAVLPTGAAFVVDGHTRRALWDSGKLTPPPYLQCVIHSVADMEGVEAAYLTYDSKFSAKGGSDAVQSSYSKFGLRVSTPWIAAGNITAILDLASNTWRAAYPRALTATARTKQEEVQFFREAILFFDALNPSQALFPMGLAAAALIDFKKNGHKAVDFWASYIATLGVQNGLASDMICRLHAFRKEMKHSGRFCGMANNKEMLAKTLLFAETNRANPGKLYAKAPKTRAVIDLIRI